MKIMSRPVKWVGMFNKDQVYGGEKRPELWDHILKVNGKAGLNKKNRDKAIKILKDKGWKVDKVD